MLRFDGVDLHYGSFRALSGVTLHASAGELVVLLGANGAGKTSIFMAASGIQQAERRQHPLRRARTGGPAAGPDRRVGPGALPRGTQAVSDDVGQEEPHAGRLRAPARCGRHPALARRGVRAVSDAGAETGPSGGFAVGRPAADGGDRPRLLGRPRLLLLDEPSLGLAPLIVKQVFEVIQRINQAGTTVLLAEQNAYLGPGDRRPRLRDRARPHRARGRSRFAAAQRGGARRLHRSLRLCGTDQEPAQQFCSVLN